VRVCPEEFISTGASGAVSAERVPA
jgi:hypothetical protein